MSKNILIVDDSASTRNIMSIALKVGGYNIIQASDGQDALEKLNKYNVDLIITDLNMPNMDGRELISNVKKIRSFETTPIIVLSSLTSKTEVDATMKVGAAAYLRKPVSNRILQEEVEKFL